MTGGIVCVLSRTGINFGAGMTGGFAYVLNEHNDFRNFVNLELVKVLTSVDLPMYEKHLHGLLSKHVDLTVLHRGKELLTY
ncbi:hypothetical protein [Candidatus Steffania adelgidicola]|uniref:GltB/FmdC/FwdC-like GXGXG domain-containing protein n=1 Tax=Candidatus Steffania adelgidicola TaxID=1076626 RepID=UPI002494069D